MSSARDELDAALAADDPLRVLRAALLWAAAAADAARADADDAAAVEAVIGLDDALTDLERLTSAVPALLDAAQLGPSVERYMHERSRELSQLGERVAAARAVHDELSRLEAGRRERLTELAELQDEVGELRRLERLVLALDELEPQRRLIGARLAALKTAAGDTERAIESEGRELAQLSEQALSALAPSTRELAQRLIAVEAELASEEARAERDQHALTAAAERTRQLRETHDGRAAALAAHASADRQLAAALTALGGLPPGPERSSLERAQVMLDELDARLAELDDVLGKALTQLDEAARREHAVVGWSDAGA